MLDFVNKGFFTLLPWRLVKHLPGLRVSPLGIIPQRARRPRLIVDYSFYGINAETVKLAPNEAMQFGRTLERTLQQIRHADPIHGPVYLSKVDLADGFYRFGLALSGISKLGIVFPTYEGEEQLIAFPFVLPMGWVESPPAFCAGTETVADLANARSNRPLPKHPLEDDAMTPPLEPPSLPSPTTDIAAEEEQQAAPPPLGYRRRLRCYRARLRHHDIYVDDYISLVQGSAKQRRQHLRRLLYSIDEVFRPLDTSDNKHRKHVPSVKKMKAGDANYDTRKIILGWIVDTVKGIITLPEHRHERLLEIFDCLRHRRRVSLGKWHKVLGELRSMSLGVPGSKGLFSLLQTGITYSEANRIRLTPAMKAHLADFEHLAQDLRHRHTSIAELVPDTPVALGPVDASGEGMGGAWLPATTHSTLDPIVWRQRFPADITADLVSDKNPTGTITNSDLELAGTVAHQDVLVQHRNCNYRTVHILNDNVPAVAWRKKGSATTTGPAAYLLGVSALHQRHHRFLALIDHIPGVANAIADDLSRLWHLNDSQLLDHLDSLYPQKQPWRMVHLRPEMHSSLTTALRASRPPPQLYLNAPKTKTVIGASGLHSATPLACLQTYHQSRTSFLFSKYSPYDYDRENLHPARNLSELSEWRTSYAPSARRWPTWGPQIRA
jgi:hypothetical protein